MQTVAQAWLVYRLTNSAWLLGVLGFLGQIPVLLLAPAGGVVADRWKRQRVIMATQSSSMLLAFILAALTLGGVVRVWEIIVLSALLSAVNAFDIPARQAFLVDLVGRKDLMNAIALNSSMYTATRMVGPAAAGIIVANVGEGWCFLANGMSYIAVIIGLLLMRLSPRVAHPPKSPSVTLIVQGFQFVRKTAPIRSLLLVLGVVSLVASSALTLMPIFADRILHHGVRGLGVLMGASGVGALLGTLTLAIKRGVRDLGRWIPICCGMFGAGLILFAWSKIYTVSVLLVVPLGFAMMLQMASSNTLIQAMVPDELRGRTMAIYSMMFMGMAPVGALLAGGAAENIGTPATIAIGGTLALLTAAVFAHYLPDLHGQLQELITSQGLAPARMLKK